MAKITLTDITSGYSLTTTANANNALIEAAIENTLSRDGTSPNTMGANLDMNSNRIVNIANGSNSQDAVTVAQLANATGSAVGLLEIVEDASPQLGAALDGQGFDLNNIGVVFLTEQAAAEADVAGKGQIWVSSADNFPRYTDENGTDYSLVLITSNVLDLADDTLKKATLLDFSITSSTVASTAGAVTFNCETANAFQHTLDENITSITLSNPPASGKLGEIVIKFIQDGTGSRTVAGWPASVKWPGGSAPTMTATASTGVDIIILKTWDGGTTWYGDYSQDYS